MAASPYPTPTRYEGLATAMFELFERSASPSARAMSGARGCAFSACLDRHADFVVCSLLSAEIAVQENPSLTMLMDLGKETYMTNTMLIFAEPGHTEVEDGMRVGLDYSCYDHPEINRVASEGKNVTFGPRKLHQRPQHAPQPGDRRERMRPRNLCHRFPRAVQRTRRPQGAHAQGSPRRAATPSSSCARGTTP